MTYSLRLLFIAFLLPIFCHAQSNYKPGYVVTLKGDTIHGYIDYKEWENNPTSINFKPELNKPAQKFTPNEIENFQVIFPYTQSNYKTWLRL